MTNYTHGIEADVLLSEAIEVEVLETPPSSRIISIGPLDMPLSPSVYAAANREAKLRSIEETLVENILLKREVRLRVEQVLQLHNLFRHTLANGDEAIDGNQGNRLPLFLLDESGDAHLPLQTRYGFSPGQLYLPTDVLNEEGISDEQQPPINRTMSDSMLEWMEITRSDAIEKVGKGTILARDLTIGAISGWVAAFGMKKFGSVAITALGGGLVLLYTANTRGYVVVNWGEIFSQLERGAKSELSSPEKAKNEAGPMTWLAEKIEKFQKWSKDNSNIAVGFVAGFLYKTYTY